MKGQTQALTGVLITAVTVGAVATAYVWGTPLLEKRQSKAQLERVESDVLNLRDKIVSVSESGSGTSSTATLQIPEGRLRINEEKDYIQVFARGSSTSYATGRWTLIKGGSLQNLTIGSGSYASKKEDLPATVAVKAASGGGDTVVQYRIEFRNMYTETPSGTRLEKIDIVTTGRDRSSGETKLQITNQGENLNQEGIRVSTGEKIPRKRTIVEVDVQ